MATTSLWRIKGRLDGVLLYASNPDKTVGEDLIRAPAGTDIESLEDVITYASREDATNRRKFVYGINCAPQTARSEMMAVKKKFEKTGGTVAYHGYQSFAEGEVTPEAAHQIGIDLATRLWGDKFQVLVATHLDKKSHLHNHFVINTVSFVDGQKFHRTKADYYRMRQESDRLCLEHGLSVIDRPEGRGKNYGEWLADNAGLPTVRGQIRADIDRAISASLTEREFFEQLHEMGYQIKLYTPAGKPLKYPALKPDGAKGFFRFHKLGPGYSLDELGEKILNNTRRKVPFPEAEAEKVTRYRRDNAPKKKYKGLQALYIKYCFELGVIKRFPASAKRVSFFMKEDLTKLDSFNAQSRLLAENNIITIDDLNQFRQTVKTKLSDYDNVRKSLKNELKRQMRAEDSESAAKTKEKISAVTSEMAKIRKNLRLSDTIEERSKRMEEGLKTVSDEEKKEVQDEQLFERRSGTGNENIPGRN